MHRLVYTCLLHAVMWSHVLFYGIVCTFPIGDVNGQGTTGATPATLGSRAEKLSKDLVLHFTEYTCEWEHMY